MSTEPDWAHEAAGEVCNLLERADVADAIRRYAAPLIAERDELLAENEKMSRIHSYGGHSGTAPEEMYVTAPTIMGCDAWHQLYRACFSDVVPEQKHEVDVGEAFQPVRYVRGDVADASVAEARRLREALAKISSDGVCRCDEARTCDYCLARAALAHPHDTMKP